MGSGNHSECNGGEFLMASMLYTLYKNDGSGESEEFTFEPGAIFPDAAALFNESTLEFIEWNESADGSSTSYSIGDTIPDMGDYYAIWETPDPVPYITTDQELKSIANAIRTKGNTSTQLQFPTGFVSAIEAISTGITPTGTKQISITQNGTRTEDVTNYANAAITVAIPIYNGEIVVPTFYEVTVSLTNPNHPSSFSSVGIYEMSDSNTVGNKLGLIDSATGSTTIDVDPSLYGLKIVFGSNVWYYTSSISTTGDISLTSPSGSGGTSELPIFSVNSSGTIVLDWIDWDF